MFISEVGKSVPSKREYTTVSREPREDALKPLGVSNRQASSAQTKQIQP